MNGPWDILKTLSDPTRVRLLALLSREELSVAELQEILAMGQSRISSQLALLRSANLVSDRREGKNAFYSRRSDVPAAMQALVVAALGAVAESDPMQAALGFALSRPEAAKVIVSVTTAQELAAMIAAAASPPPELDWEGMAIDDAAALNQGMVAA